MIGFVYLWYDRKRKMFYLGSHIGNLDEGYISGSKYFLREYQLRPEDFKRRILKIFYRGSWKFVRELEARLLATLRKEELGTRYYNKYRIATGGLARVRPEMRVKMSASAIERFADPVKNKEHGDRQKIRFLDPAQRANTSIRTSLAMARPDVKANVSRAQLKRYESQEQRDNQKRCGALASHNRWHVSRGLISENCIYCSYC